jgi:hypothetical protein
VDGKQLLRMGATIGNMYSTCMEQYCLRLLVALASYLVNIIQDGYFINEYALDSAQGTLSYISVDKVFQVWSLRRFRKILPIGTCISIRKVMQYHPSTGTCWSENVDVTCAAPIYIVPAFMEPTIYRRDDAQRPHINYSSIVRYHGIGSDH